MTEPKTRSILVQLTGGRQKIISGVPLNAKVTFGKVTPGEKEYGGSKYALRIYTTQNNQLAVFLDVVEFRDLSLTVKSRSTTTKSKGKTERDGDGRVLTSVQQTEVEDEWEDEDV